MGFGRSRGWKRAQAKKVRDFTICSFQDVKLTQGHRNLPLGLTEAFITTINDSHESSFHFSSLIRYLLFSFCSVLEKDHPTSRILPSPHSPLATKRREHIPLRLFEFLKNRLPSLLRPHINLQSIWFRTNQESFTIPCRRIRIRQNGLSIRILPRRELKCPQ